MMMIRRLALASALSLILAAPLAAETGTEKLFDTGQLSDVATGTVLDYAHARTIPEDEENIRAIDSGAILVALFEEGDKRITKVTLREGKRKRSLQNLPADRGNPVFIAFLESTLQAVTHSTKGSPFYLRNRFKDMLATGGTMTETTVIVDGETIPATRIDFVPFEKDKHRDKLGAFADLSVSFTIAEGIPGSFFELSAKTKTEEFSETMRYRGAHAGNE